MGLVMTNDGDVVTVGEHEGVYLEGLGRAYKN